MRISKRFYIQTLAAIGLICGFGMNSYSAGSLGGTSTVVSSTNCGTQPTCKSCTCYYNSSAGYYWGNCTSITTGSCATSGTTSTGGTTSIGTSRNSISRAYNSTTNSQLTVKYPTVTTDSTPVKDFDFAVTDSAGNRLYPDCPLDPSNYTTTQATNLTTTQSQTPLAPDINNQMPTSTSSISSTYYYTTSGGKPVAPPDQCVVRSRVMCGTSPCTSTSQTITSAVAAVCPDGYVQVGAFDMQPEVAYNPAPAAMPYPIPDMATYNSYVAKGYDCKIKQLYSADYCIYSAYSPSTTYFGTFDRTTDQYITGSISYTDNQGSPTKGVGRYYSASSDYVCQVGRDCGGAMAGCNLDRSTPNCQDTVNSSLYIACTNNGTAFSQKYTISYGLYECTPKAGPYFTTNMAPRALVCARIKAQHDSVNK